MILATNKTVRELALETPAATRLFEKIGIDYCCGGKRSLADACAVAGVELEDVQQQLSTLTGAPDKEPNFQSATLKELMDHIVRKHHIFARLETARLNALMEKVYLAHGDNHPELLQISVLFHELGAELETHMTKEEQVLFPYITRMEAAKQQCIPLARPPFGTIKRPVRVMVLEHDRAGEFLREIRTLSSNYTPPGDGCISYQTLYAAFAALEQDLHEHIHLENNILFPRAVEMEPIADAISVC